LTCRINQTKFIESSQDREAKAVKTVNIHEAKTHLSRLIDQAVKGDPFVIAKAGKPLVKVMALDAPEKGQMRRLGFFAGKMTVPDDFDQMGAEQIEQLFGGPA
jgi:prevent-host-death family protein